MLIIAGLLFLSDSLLLCPICLDLTHFSHFFFNFYLSNLLQVSAEFSFPIKTQYKQSILNFKRLHCLNICLLLNPPSPSMCAIGWLWGLLMPMPRWLIPAENTRSEGLLRLREVSAAIPAPEVQCPCCCTLSGRCAIQNLPHIGHGLSWDSVQQLVIVRKNIMESQNHTESSSLEKFSKVIESKLWPITTQTTWPEH